jgi:hypothetical protein
LDRDRFAVVADDDDVGWLLSDAVVPVLDLALRFIAVLVVRGILLDGI